MSKELEEFKALLSTRSQAHPWHGESAGDEAPQVVNAFIEIVPRSTVKMELGKRTGHLGIDRPQRFSSLCPMPYGLVPQTYCGDLVAEFCAQRTGKKRIEGDGDPLDICILTGHDFSHPGIFLRARPIGGLRMIDKGQADDKIIAVLVDDATFDGVKNISDCPKGVIERLEHYFLSYKQLPGERRRTVKITDVYGRRDAYEVIERSRRDYVAKFGTEEDRLERLGELLIALMNSTPANLRRPRPKK